jgi:rubrerythrin
MTSLSASGYYSCEYLSDRDEMSFGAIEKGFSWRMKVTIEQDRTLQALKVAIQMEIDGKAYYLKASRESGNELGKKLLSSLASEEDIHRRKFEEIYNSIRARKGWPVTDFKPSWGQKIRTVFAEATERMAPSVKVAGSELNAVKTAMDMENETYDYYQKRGKAAILDAEREFYETLAGEEREHHIVLLDYYEYLKDPAGWFVKAEHPSLDGG